MSGFPPYPSPESPASPPVPGGKGNLDLGGGGTINPDDVNNYVIIDPGLLPALVLIFYFILQIPVSAFGVVTNALNVVIFTLSGQRDSVSVALTALSVSDLAYSVCSLLARTLEMLDTVLLVESPVRLGDKGLGQYLAYLAYLWQHVSVVVTVFVAVQKCCCVAIPHVFKNVFSPRRTLAAITCLTVGIALTHTVRLGGFTFRATTFPPGSNGTIISSVANQLYHNGRGFWLAFHKISFPALSQATTVVCIAVMAVQLRRSARFRHASTDAAAASAQEDNIIKPSSTSDSRMRSSYKMGRRERRVVTCLALVSTILVVSSLPTFLWANFRLLAPHFTEVALPSSFNRLLNRCQVMPLHVNASVNIFVYLKYNTKFKRTAELLFKKCLCHRDGRTDGNGKKKDTVGMRIQA